MKKLIVIAGPTASGKTALAIDIALKLKTEIISADSRQCYKEMNIGVARPSVDELNQVQHHFIASHSITEQITAGKYEQLALSYCADVFSRHDTAVLVGGTGLYIKALCNGLDEMPNVDEAIVAEIENQFKLNGLEWLQAETQKADPVFFNDADINNPRRLVRALSFIRSTGHSITKYQTAVAKERDFQVVYHVIDSNREELYQRIDKRVHTMFEQGLLQEVASLQQYVGNKNLDTVGYTECFKHLSGDYSLDECISKIQQNTRHYAKRQVTWFKKMYAQQFASALEIASMY